MGSKKHKKRRERSTSTPPVASPSTASPPSKPKDKPQAKPEHKPQAKPQDKSQTKPQDKSKSKSKNKPTDKPQEKKKPIDNNSNNPLLEQQRKFLQSLTPQDRDGFFSDALVPPERRAELWMAQAQVGEELVNNYAWATPNDQAMRILKHLSPLVEIGCGANAYWLKLMQRQAGIDIVGYDVNLEQGGTIVDTDNSNATKQLDRNKRKGSDPSFRIRQGGPNVLELKENAKRTLFLCYPDEDDQEPEEQDDEDEDNNNNYDDDREPQAPTSMGWRCLDHYQGDHVIHVGELFSDANLSIDQAPWGRSSSPEFQQRLASEYHCLLKAQLPNWLHTRDSISVWKRSETCAIVFAADEEEDSDEDEEVEYRHIPLDERLPSDLAAPCLQHLLSGGKGTASTSTPSATPPQEPKAKKQKVEKKQVGKKAVAKSPVESDDDDKSEEDAKQIGMDGKLGTPW
jgi:hypothetical protein